MTAVMTEETRARLKQLYVFLREANQIRFRPVRSLSEQPKFIRLAELPSHPSVQVFRPAHADQGPSEVLLAVRRPSLTRCPAPPPTVVPWLRPHWNEPFKNVEVSGSRNVSGPDGQAITEQFDDDADRVIAFNEWLRQRDAWVGPECDARVAMTFFEKFYEIHSTLEKEGEQLELLVADGHLLWRAKSGLDGTVTVNHPVLLKRVELLFDPKVPQFILRDTDREAEIYTGLFVDLEGVSPEAIRKRQSAIQETPYHPWGFEDTDGFLKSFIQTVSPVRGEFLALVPSDGPSDVPRMFRDTVLVLRKRVAGIANAVDAIIDHIDRSDVFAPALAQITGTVEGWSEAGLGGTVSSGSSGDGLSPTLESETVDALLTKETNKEQLQIIRRLNHRGAVNVQGPPGTGKTHTIGNLIGHLLAQGKSVLVTAHTAKALRVLRDKVPAMLQPLAVSVLGSDQQARRQLDLAVSSITERLSGETSESLLAAAGELGRERLELVKAIADLRGQLRTSLENEYRDIVLEGRAYSPSDAARLVASAEAQNSWIPGPVALGAAVSLSPTELSRLYELGKLVSSTEEADSRMSVPPLDGIPSAERFESIVAVYRKLTTKDLTFGLETWVSSTGSAASIEAIGEEIAKEFSDGLKSQAWRPHAIVAGLHGGTEREVWEQLLSQLGEAVEANARLALLAHHHPVLSTTLPPDRQVTLCGEILAHLEAGGSLSAFTLITRSEWRHFLRSASVSAGRPSHRDHFEALRRLAKVEELRIVTGSGWDRLIGQHIGKPFGQMGPEPELACRALIPEIRRCLDWHVAVWTPLVESLRSNGLHFDAVSAAVPTQTGLASEYSAIERVATEVLPGLLGHEAERRRLRETEAALDDVLGRLTGGGTGAVLVGVGARFASAVRERDPEQYFESLKYARRLLEVQPLVVERDELLRRLATTAPAWAQAIARRQAPHDEDRLPGDVVEAWTWRQLHDALAERDRLDPHELQRHIDRAERRLRAVTESLIDARAWGRQLQRLDRDHSLRQALVGWLDTTKRLMSVRAADKREALQVEARKLMKRCADAVPVWIMPISIVAESFDPSRTRFDVVVLDEASQADLNGLIPLYMGEQVVVVGDHEQVTPLGVGQQSTILDNLRRSHLQDVPNSHLFDHQASIYDIARQSFGDSIRLVEHFRCVPEIIAFSNQLSYNGAIRPLRESASSAIKPACVALRSNGVRVGKTNEGEARQILDLIGAMIRHPLYVGKTIGVISMVGEEQAKLIQAMLHKNISGVEIDGRRIQAGISGDFQGDERDVVFLSLVDSQSDEGPLRTTGEGAFELFKKRYNVAASRARDQLWVIHSFDPDIHLTASDIRLRLLRHVRDPEATMRLLEQEQGAAESPFEQEVLRRLVGAGYRVRSQWRVGYYRIDIVVEGAGKRLAVECDGDRFHPIDKLADDMERQTILERLGWTFVRIRGSAFYRDPDQAMAPVFERLRDLGITADGVTTGPPPTDRTLINELLAMAQPSAQAPADGWVE